MRALLIPMILVLASATAAAEDDAPVDAGRFDVDVTEVTATGGGGVETTVVHRALAILDDLTLKCYADAEGQARTLAGTITLKFRLDVRGAASNVAVTGLPRVNTCLIAAIKAATFSGTAKGPIDIREKVNLRIREPKAGILGSTGSTQGGAFASLTGTGDVSSDAEGFTYYGGLLGNEAGEMNGGFGYGRSGFGPGGGGTGWGTIGTGRYRQSVAIGRATVSSDADKDAIRAAVEPRLSELETCYAQALASAPKLEGTATVRFRIDPSGKVGSATSTGFAKLGPCVERVIAATGFPAPTTGAAVDASYAFIFRTLTGSKGRTAVATVVIGQPAAQGDLDKAIIRRYIKRNLQKIQYCYEKRLLVVPRLAGTVTAKFTIDAAGKVTDSKANGIGDTEVHSCIAEVIKNIEFPRPKTGEVDVTYPFTFHADDDKKP